MSDKPAKPKPQIYTFLFGPLQQIAKSMGYNLLIHGSMNRDCDLVAIPWIDEPDSELQLVQEMHRFLSGNCWSLKEQYCWGMLPGGRSTYCILMNRGRVDRYNQWKPDEDEQWYLDISITPLLKTTII